MEIWNSKSGGNMYIEFKATFGVFPEVHFGQSVYFFEALEVRSPMLQIVCKLELKRGSYVRLKQLGWRGRLSSKLTT